MLRNIKCGKILVVVFLTILIWVWADLAKTEGDVVRNATVNVVEATNPNVWVSLDGRSSVTIDVIAFKGPTSRIERVKRRIRRGKGFIFDFDAAQWGMTEPGTHRLDLLQFLRKEKQLTRLGLEIESCKPETISVDVQRLVEKWLAVTCVDQEGNPVVAEVDPPQIEISVPEGLARVAEVQLSPAEIEQARTSAGLSKKPYVRLGAKTKLADEPVKITVQDLLEVSKIDSPVLGYTFSGSLQGEYEVELDNPTVVRGPIQIRATRKAKTEYENATYHIRLEIRDSDKVLKTGESFKRRQLIYHFPPEYVSRKEIQLIGQPVEAHFRLKPVRSGEAAAGQ
jgi:hypothetical protein